MALSWDWSGWERFPAGLTPAWTDDYEVPFLANGGLGATLRSNGEPAVFASGPNHSAFRTHFSFDDGTYHDWEELQGGLKTDTVSACLLGPIILAARSMENNRVYWKFQDWGPTPDLPPWYPPREYFEDAPSWLEVEGGFLTDTGVAVTSVPYLFARNASTGEVWFTGASPSGAADWSGRWSVVPASGFVTEYAGPVGGPAPSMRTAVAPAVNAESFGPNSRVLIVVVQAGTDLLYWNALEFASDLSSLGWTGWTPIEGDLPFASDEQAKTLRPASLEKFRTDVSPCVVDNVVFAVGRDNDIYSNALEPAGATWDHQRPTSYTWTGWQRIGGLQTKQPVAGVRGWSQADGKPAPGYQTTYWLYAQGLDDYLYFNTAVL
ncbi:MAG TPA: hypothetical protein VEH52_14050 [Gaiellaceae bacterium]|nr:hypothetical protein [Gaiellaceae bacterium]